MTTTVISYIITAVFAGLVSTLATIFSLFFLLKKYFILETKKEKNSLDSGKDLRLKNSTENSEQSIDVQSLEEVSDNGENRRIKHVSLYESMLSTEKKFPWYKKCIKNSKVFYQALLAALYTTCDKILSSIFVFLYFVLKPIILPLSKVVFTFKKYLSVVRLKTFLGSLKHQFSFKNSTPTHFQIFTTDIKVPETAAPTFTKSNFNQVDSFFKEIHNEGKSKIISSDIFSDILLSLVPVAFVVLPFIFKLQTINTNVFFIYLFAVSILGSFLLLYIKSPRAFWSIGISIWSAIGYFFYSLKQDIDSLVPSSTLFLSAFLFVYVTSAVLWYGGSSIKKRIVEYSLYTLHVLLYLTALYLLINTLSPFILGFVYISLACFFYAIAHRTLTKKGDYVFANISMFLSLISFTSAILVTTDGVLEIILLSLAYFILYFKYKNTAPTYSLVPALFLFFKTLELTNISKVFTPVLNERFIGYMVAAFVFGHLYSILLRRRIHFGMHSKLIKRIASLFSLVLFIFGITLEVFDTKINTTLLPGKSAYILLLVLYLFTALYLYLFGKKYIQKSFLVFSAVVSLYIIYFISKNLL